MRVNILGIEIDSLGRWEAMRKITRRMAADQQTAVFTPNPIMIGRALRDRSFTEILNQGDLNLADGIGILLAARLLGLPSPPRTAGIDFGEALLAYAASAGLRVFLLGGRPGVAEKAAHILRLRFPQLNVCGTHHGYFQNEQTEALRAHIRAAAPHMVLVCLGSPKQERWIAENRHHLSQVKIFMGLGGSLDVWSGTVIRAPQLLSNLGLEWLWRMILEPRRLSDLPLILSFLLAAAKEGWHNTKRQPARQ